LNWNGRQKIRSCFSISDIISMKWKEEDFKCLLEKTTTIEHRKEREKSYDLLLPAWSKVGTPGFMLQTRFMNNITEVEAEADRLKYLWPQISSSQNIKE